MRELDVIVSRVVSVLRPGGRALVAVDGVGGSGKSTFAASLAKCITDRPVVILHVDDFFQPSPPLDCGVIHHPDARLSRGPLRAPRTRAQLSP